MENGIYAIFETQKGRIKINLTYEETPGTVGNFVNLVEGKVKNTHKPIDQPFFDGLKFHRVIKDFMIQGGCPLGDGTGDPGYKFDDEFSKTLRHNKPGVLSMANSGPNTNGSQFFITHVETQWLDDKHTVFGNVIEGQEVVNIIEQDDEIERITIERIGDEAKQWDSIRIFDEFNQEKSIREKKMP